MFEEPNIHMISPSWVKFRRDETGIHSEFCLWIKLSVTIYKNNYKYHLRFMKKMIQIRKIC